MVAWPCALGQSIMAAGVCSVEKHLHLMVDRDQEQPLKACPQ
jgi:hypothetical protein